MRTIVSSLATCLVLGACASQFEPVEANSAYNQIGATVKTPDEPGWTLAYARPTGMALGKRDANGVTVVILTDVSRITGSSNNEQFFGKVIASRREDSDPGRFNIFAEKYTPVSFKNADCIATETTALDKNSPASAPNYLKNTGYVCRHPVNTDVAFLMELSVRSTETTLSPADRATAEAFFAGVTLNDYGL